jgi:hypothetical protein
MAKDWVAWHGEYDESGSPLSKRLAVVVGILTAALDDAPVGDVRVVSLCAGDARDLAAAASGHPRAEDLVGCVVEFDPTLADRAVLNLADVCPRIRVVCADAGDPLSFVDALPVDVLLLAGIFGNISDADIRRTIGAVPYMCRSGATVVWTRHRRDPDLTPTIRSWFAGAGCRSVRFESPGTAKFAVGAEIHLGPTLPDPPQARLFSFRDDLW